MATGTDGKEIDLSVQRAWKLLIGEQTFILAWAINATWSNIIHALFPVCLPGMSVIPKEVCQVTRGLPC